MVSFSVLEFSGQIFDNLIMINQSSIKHPSYHLLTVFLFLDFLHVKCFLAFILLVLGWGISNISTIFVSCPPPQFLTCIYSNLQFLSFTYICICNIYILIHIWVHWCCYYIYVFRKFHMRLENILQACPLRSLVPLS